MDTFQWAENENCIKVLSRHHSVKTWCSDWTTLDIFAQTNACWASPGRTATEKQWLLLLNTLSSYWPYSNQPSLTKPWNTSIAKYNIQISENFPYNFKSVVFKIFWIYTLMFNTVILCLLERDGILIPSVFVYACVIRCVCVNEK